MSGPSFPTFTKALILICAISLAFLHDPIPSTFSFIICSWAGTVISHDHFNGYRCYIAHPRCNFPALILTSLTLPSPPGYTSVMISSFRCTFFHSFSDNHFLYFHLWFYFCYCTLSNSSYVRYSFLRVFNFASLNLCLCFCLFHKSLFSIFNIDLNPGDLAIKLETEHPLLLKSLAHC